MFISAMRPRQWGKNLLVVVAPLAGGRLLEPGVALRVLAAFAIFATASSAMYLLNDVADRHRDAAHPVKRERPIASGRLSVRRAIVGSIVLSVTALSGAALLGPSALVGVIALYLGGTVLYTLRLKHEPLYDVVLVASGFLLRAIAGGVATATVISTWFLVTATFGALFIAAGKRASEHANGAVDAGTTRPSLAAYSTGYLRFLWMLAATVTVTAAAVWGLEVATASARPGLAQASVAPFTLIILRYAWWIDRGEAEAPEDVLRRDRGLVLLGVIWAVLLLASTGAIA
jgi:decaprenyl-phosphate phosphoribosyltransferase